MNRHNLKRNALAWHRDQLRWLLLLWAVGVAAVQAEEPEQLLTSEKMAAALEQHVLGTGPWKRGDVEVRITPFKPVPVPRGPVKIRVLRPVKGITPGVHTFLVAADVAGHEAAKIWVRTEIRLYDTVVVASHPLAHHELVNAKNVRLERREVTFLSTRPFTHIEEVIGKQAARPIEVNEVLTQMSLERPTLVRRGSAIILVYETGRLRVETPGMAEEAGKVGDMIHVKNPSSGKVMRGQVVDDRTVRVN